MLRSQQDVLIVKEKEGMILHQLRDITRNELKDLIRTIPFLTIGKMFNVTDNAIRKWCIHYNLPKTKKEIKSYSNEEWEKI